MVRGEGLNYIISSFQKISKTGYYPLSNLKEISKNSVGSVCHAEIHWNTLPNEGIGVFVVLVCWFFWFCLFVFYTVLFEG